MIVEEIKTSAPEETEKVAAELAKRLKAGDLVLLAGDLGTGKTTFVRGAAQALGVTALITSPTFTIGNLYDGAGGEVAHLDLYRLDAVDGADDAMLDDFLRPDRIAFIEWPHDQLADFENLRAVVTLSHAGGDNRSIAIEWFGDEASGPGGAS